MDPEHLDRMKKLCEGRQTCLVLTDNRQDEWVSGYTKLRRPRIDCVFNQATTLVFVATLLRKLFVFLSQLVVVKVIEYYGNYFGAESKSVRIKMLSKNIYSYEQIFGTYKGNGNIKIINFKNKSLLLNIVIGQN